jgi:hypothetical protein
MNYFLRKIRLIPKLRFKLLNLATIKDTQKDRFNSLIKDYKHNGWNQTFEYSGFDA